MSEVKSINPYNNKVVGTYQLHSKEEIQTILHKANERYLEWRATGINHRSRLMHNAAGILRSDAEKYAVVISEEMGSHTQNFITRIQL